MATQHPYATPVWLDSLAALSQGQLSDDLLLIVDLERELAREEKRKRKEDRRVEKEDKKKRRKEEKREERERSNET